MKLYNVEVTYQLVIRAESQQAAEQQAGYIVRREDDGEPTAVSAAEIETVADLEKPWDGDCRPWGERDPMDRTISQILAAKEQS